MLRWSTLLLRGSQSILMVSLSSLKRSMWITILSD